VSEIDYGKLTKRIVFTETDHRHAQLIIRLKHDNFKQSQFFRSLITGYIEQDERIQSYIEEVSGESQKKVAKSRKLRSTGQEMKKSMGLSNDDVNDIFDLIAEEHPEL
jgi:hypothetical protein